MLVAKDGLHAYRSSDNGDSWEVINTRGWFLGANTLLLTGAPFRSSDLGTTWDTAYMSIPFAEGDGFELEQLEFANGRYFLSTEREDGRWWSGVLMSEDNGLNWRSIGPDLHGEDFTFGVSQGQVVYNDETGLFATSDLGQQWRRLTNRPFRSLVSNDSLLIWQNYGAYFEDSLWSWDLTRDIPDDSLALTYGTTPIAQPESRRIFFMEGDSLLHSWTPGGGSVRTYAMDGLPPFPLYHRILLQVSPHFLYMRVFQPQADVDQLWIASISDLRLVNNSSVVMNQSDARPVKVQVFDLMGRPYGNQFDSFDEAINSIQADGFYFLVASDGTVRKVINEH